MKSDDPKRAKAIIIDHGLFYGLAQTLAPYFDTIFYYVPWDGLFPDAKRALIGDGFSEVTRVQDFWKTVKECDLVITPDVYGSDILNHCCYELKKRCWGSGDGEFLELDRWKARSTIEKAGLPANPAEKIVGIDRLRKYLEANDNKYVKISKYRGISESFHHTEYRLSEPHLDELEHSLGMQKNELPFIVEDVIEGDCEPGWDGYVIDGQVAKTGIVGFEVKDKGYIGAVQPYSQTYKGLRAINEALVPTFEKTEYRGFFSSEARISEGKCFPIDLTARLATPAGEIYLSLYSNWADIIWRGSVGELVEPEPAAKYGAQVIMKSTWAERDWQAIFFPSKIAPWVKLYNPCRINGQTCIIPQEAAHLKEIGSVIGIGATLEEAIQKCKDHAELIEGYQIEINVSVLDDADEIIKNAENVGVNFHPK